MLDQPPEQLVHRLPAPDKAELTDGFLIRQQMIDNSAAEGFPMVQVNAELLLLLTIVRDEEGRVTAALVLPEQLLPDEPFHVVLDVGPGHAQHIEELHQRSALLITGAEDVLHQQAFIYPQGRHLGYGLAVDAHVQLARTVYKSSVRHVICSFPESFSRVEQMPANGGFAHAQSAGDFPLGHLIDIVKDEYLPLEAVQPDDPLVYPDPQMLLLLPLGEALSEVLRVGMGILQRQHMPACALPLGFQPHIFRHLPQEVLRLFHGAGEAFLPFHGGKELQPHLLGQVFGTGAVAGFPPGPSEQRRGICIHPAVEFFQHGFCPPCRG